MIEAQVCGVDLRLETGPKLFSPGSIDRGTLAMLSQVKFQPEDKVLDLGCGYGVVGIAAAKLIGGEQVYMSDVDPGAVKMARVNAETNGVPEVTIVQSDGFQAITEAGFTLILSNPPYHTDFSVAKRFIEKGFNRLVIGGRMVLVTKREIWYRKKLMSIFGGVKVVLTDGYYVFTAERRQARYGNK